MLTPLLIGAVALCIPCGTQARPVRVQSDASDGIVIPMLYRYKIAYIQMGLGTPSQVMTLQVDTGSSNMWVMSKDCQSQNCAIAWTKFNQADSASFALPATAAASSVIPISTPRASQNSFQLTYGMGQVDAYDVRETLAFDQVLRNGTHKLLTVPNQVINLATGVHDFSNNMDGILGFGTSKGIRGGSKVSSFIDTLYQAKAIQRRLFALYFGQRPAISQLTNVNQLNGTCLARDGSVSVGMYNPAVKPKSFWMKMVDINGLYAIGMYGLRVGNTSVHLPDAVASVTIMDSGCSSMGVPDATMADLKQLLNGTLVDGRLYVPCASIPALPTVTFQLNTDGLDADRKASPKGAQALLVGLLPSHYLADPMQNPLNPATKLCKTHFNTFNFNNYVLLGSPFLELYYSIFDVDNGRFGLAPLPL